MTVPTNVHDEAIALHQAALELALDAQFHAHVFPREEWPELRRDMRRRMEDLSRRADTLSAALGAPPVPGQQQVVALKLNDYLRRTRGFLSFTFEHIDEKGMKTRR